MQFAKWWLWSYFLTMGTGIIIFFFNIESLFKCKLFQVYGPPWSLMIKKFPGAKMTKQERKKINKDF